MMMSFTRLASGFLRLFLLLALTLTATAADIVFLVKTGTDAQGNPIFRTADGRDSYLTNLHQRVQSSRSIQSISRYYDAVQQDKIAQALSSRGYSQDQVRQYLSTYRPDPVYIEVNGNSTGAFNDWKGKFHVTMGNGTSYSIQSPRIVFPLGSQVMRSGDWSLIEQTVVHEIAHSVQSKSYGVSQLPETPWLSKSHAGGTTTDEVLALIEGYAEFAGSYFTGRLTIAEDPHNALGSNWYARDSRTGRLKSYSQLARTEGWVATTLYTIADRGRNQDAFWKITRVMSYTRPKTMPELLASVQRYYPELAPLIQSVIYETSGGQVGRPYTQTSPPPVAQRGTGSYGTGGNGGAVRSSDPYDQFYYALLGGGGAALSTAYQNILSWQNAAAVQGGDLTTLQRVGRGSKVLYDLYNYQAQRLAGMSTQRYYERYQIQQTMASIASLYTRQQELESRLVAQVPGAYQGGGSSYTAYQPAAPTTTADGPAAPISTTYRDVTDSLRNPAAGAAKDALEKYKQIFESRQNKRRQASGGTAP